MKNRLAPRWQAEAERMVAALGPLPPKVAEAMRRVPRHEFVAPPFRRVAYEDSPLPLPGGDSTISAPHMVAIQLEWAYLRPGLHVLEIGAGLGYLSCLIGELVRPEGSVDGVEIDRNLARLGAEKLERLGHTPPVSVHYGDGTRGWPARAPYNRIVVSCAAPRILAAWRDQLVEGGLLVAPIGDSSEQVLVRWQKHGDSGALDQGPRCRFVPLIGAGI